MLCSHFLSFNSLFNLCCTLFVVYDLVSVVLVGCCGLDLIFRLIQLMFRCMLSFGSSPYLCFDLLSHFRVIFISTFLTSLRFELFSWTHFIDLPFSGSKGSFPLGCWHEAGDGFTKDPACLLLSLYLGLDSSALEDSQVIYRLAKGIVLLTD